MMVVPRSIVWATGIVLLVLVGMVWALSMRIYGDNKEVAGYALGCAAEKARNPAAQYIESGQNFCYDGEFHQVIRAGKRGYRRTGRP